MNVKLHKQKHPHKGGTVYNQHGPNDPDRIGDESDDELDDDDQDDDEIPGYDDDEEEDDDELRSKRR